MRSGKWARRFPPSFAVATLGLALWAWRAETASGVERIWTFLAAVSLGVALWGLAEARRTRGWVGDQAERYPRLDYSSALIVAQTHNVTHLVLALVQGAFLAFGGFSALTAPINPGAPVSPVGLALTIALIGVEVLLTGLNVWLVWRRDVLLQKVAEIGGD